MYRHFVRSLRSPSRIVITVHGESTEGLQVDTLPQSNRQDTERVRKRICPALAYLLFPTGQVSSHKKLTLCLLGYVSCPLPHFSRSWSCTPQCGVLLKSNTGKVIWHGGRSIHKLMREGGREEERKGNWRNLRRVKKCVSQFTFTAYPSGKVISPGLRNCPNEMQRLVHLQHMH